ncbi:MAG: gliding motility-associated C-terminal domain-containing protein [Cytophagales bacterium]|nr:gliding motility-associated C-terminal domain-containing protein [Cytophagales bacterium]
MRYITSGTCPDTSDLSILISAPITPSLSYPSPAFCLNGTDPVPAVIGAMGGNFSSSAGLNINASTGEIDLSASTPNTYTVTYTGPATCPGSGNTTVTLNGLDDPSFNYSDTVFCTNGVDPSATVTGLAGGTFSGSSGLSINASTGEIDVNSSTLGEHTVRYITTGTCPDTSDLSILISVPIVPSLSYPSPAYCLSGTDPLPSVTGVMGGSFSSGSGLSINASTGEIDLSASTPNTYTVTYTGPVTCPSSGNTAITVNSLDDASFSYPFTEYCDSDSDPSPTVTGLPGGTFSSTSGLVINSTSGAVDISASSPGSYSVSYLTSGTCPNSSSVSFSIVAPSNVSFTLPGTTFCRNDSDPVPVITGITGGSFNASAGVVLNTTTGVVDLSASPVGLHTLTYRYNTASSCLLSSASRVFTITGDDASFGYAEASYCQNVADPTPTITGLAGGTFSSGSGLSINASTGEIDVSASTTGSYTITYTTNGACPNFSTVSIDILAADNASFNYSSSGFCLLGSNPSPTILGVPGGVFSAAPGGMAINASTGEIDLSASTAGSYSVTYTTAASCPNTLAVSVDLSSLDDAGFAYGSLEYCIAEDDPSPVITGSTGGSFSGSTGLLVNSSSGEVDLAASGAGVYTVTYATSGSCPNSSTVSLTVYANQDASFGYGASAYCKNSSDPAPLITGMTGGSFFSVTGLVVDPVSGVIDLTESDTGTYRVLYLTSGYCRDYSEVSVRVFADDASFSYASGSYCAASADPLPTVTGLSGGVFAAGTGLAINAGTGAVDLSASTAGTYKVSYTTLGTCPSSDSVSFVVTRMDSVAFSYSSSVFCLDEPNASPVNTGVPGGTYSVATAGLSLNSSTGEIDFGASTPAVYWVRYHTSGTCASQDSVRLTVSSRDDASFSYPAASFCSNESDPVPLVTGVPGGVFASTSSLSLNGSTGEIDLSASNAATHYVTYTTSGNCPDVDTVSLAIESFVSSAIAYSSTAYCLGSTNPVPVVSGQTGGVFSASPGILLNGSTGEIDLSASTPGSYMISYIVAGVCPDTSRHNLMINIVDDPSFSYPLSMFCVSEANQTPTVTGRPGGVFSSQPGLILNTNTGEIISAASLPGNYRVLYTTTGLCPDSIGMNIQINPYDNANFNYSDSVYCVTDSNPVPVVTGEPNGVFSSTNGLSINSSTGEVNLAASVGGRYSVAYTTNGNCPNSTVVGLRVNNASFFYGSAAYCVKGENPVPTITGMPGGVFSSTAGLVIDSSTGAIDLTASMSGTYTVTYTVSGSCPATNSQNVRINNTDNASFSYSDSDYCHSDTDPVPVVSGLPGGTFSALGGLVVDASTGQIDLSASVGGLYYVRYTSAGICPSTDSVLVRIDNASFFYLQSTYCRNVADPIPVVQGQLGGTFSSSTGLQIHPGTGEIDLSASPSGNHLVTYAVSGSCSDTKTFSLVLVEPDPAAFNYSSLSYCVNDPDPTPVVTGLTGGVFSSTTGLDLNSSTGEINLSGSVGGIYLVSYRTSGVCPNTNTVSVTVEDASFSFGSASYCRNGQNPVPFIFVQRGGIFSSSPGLSIDPVTGEINVAASQAGTYMVTYTTTGRCPDSKSVNIAINNADDSGFNYSSFVFCVSDPNPVPTITGLPGGVFSPLTGDLVVDAATGVVDLSATPGGTHLIAYTSAGICPSTSSTSMVINDASFNYLPNNFCADAEDPSPYISGITGGVFSAGAGLSIDPSSGVIDISASDAGSYMVNYTVTGSCPDSKSVPVSVVDLDNASFTYPNSRYCPDDFDPRPVLTGVGGGLFTSTAGLLVDQHLGTIDLSSSSPGTHTVTYTTASACPGSMSAQVTLVQQDVSAFTYPLTSYCVSGINPSPVILGNTGGTFMSTPGLALNSSNGEINLSASTSGQYSVSYTTTGTCLSTSVFDLTINDASISYQSASYCTNGEDPLPVIQGIQTGLYSSTAGLALNTTTGEIDLSRSRTGNYIVSYTTMGNCLVTRNTAVRIDTTYYGRISYSLSDFCADTQNPAPIIDGYTQGTFSAPPGLSIDSAAGLINLSASTQGTYWVVYSIGGQCPTRDSVEVTVGDRLPPRVLVRNTVVGLDETGNAVITPEQVDNNSTDNCEIGSRSLSQSSFDCSHLGDNNVVFTVADVHGNSSTDMVLVRVEDFRNPRVSTSPVQAYLDSSGIVWVRTGDLDITDNCGNYTAVINNNNTFSCADIGTNSISVTVSDPQGNTVNEIVPIEVNDTISPTITCPIDVRHQVTIFDVPRYVSVEAAQVSDNCSGVLQIRNSINGTSDASGNYSLGVTPVVWTVSDSEGNSSSCRMEVELFLDSGDSVINLSQYIETDEMRTLIYQSRLQALTTVPVNYVLTRSALDLGIQVSSEGVLEWTPEEVHGPATYSIELRAVSQSQAELVGVEVMNIVVNEVNELHVVEDVADKEVYEMQSLSFPILVNDIDLPRHSFLFELEQDFQYLGIDVNPETGIVHWVPNDSHGGNTYPVRFWVSDGTRENFRQSVVVNIRVFESLNGLIIQTISDEQQAHQVGDSTANIAITITDTQPNRDIDPSIRLVSSPPGVIDEQNFELRRNGERYDLDINVLDREYIGIVEVRVIIDDGMGSQLSAKNPQRAQAIYQLVYYLIFEREALPLNIPNMITPNGDGMNDTWNILNLSIYSENTVQVFDRFGKQVFYQENYSRQNEWDGTYDGKVLPSGPYFYVITFDGERLTGVLKIVR